MSVGLYGNEGLLPARWTLRLSGKSVVEQLKDSPTLLWFGPRLGLDTQQCMELLSLSGALISLMALAVPVLRDCRVFLILWILYLSLYQVSLLSVPVSAVYTRFIMQSQYDYEMCTTWFN